jgi:hypothetical protein
MRTPAYRHLAVVFAVFVAVLVAGSATAANVLAGRQVAYKPTAQSVVASTPDSNKSTVTPAPPDEPTPAAQPAVVTPPPQKDASTKVQAVLDSWAAGHSSQKWSVVVQGLGDDKTNASLNPSTVFGTASVYKLYFMYPLFQSYTLDSIGTTTLSIDGRPPTSMQACVELALKVSDNPCGEAIGYKVGWGKATTALRKIGMASTNLNSNSGPTSTAADTNLFLQQFYNGQLTTPEQRQYVMGLMQQQKYRSGIPAGCPGCTVADKIGDLSGVRHDVAIVQYQAGAYTLAIMTNGATYAQIAQLTSQIQTAISS